MCVCVTIQRICKASDDEALLKDKQDNGDSIADIVVWELGCSNTDGRAPETEERNVSGQLQDVHYVAIKQMKNK